MDEWAGSFDGEKRQKLEIAIQPVLEELGTLLAQASEATASLQNAAATSSAFNIEDAASHVTATDRVHVARRLVAELKSRTAGTPYAFIGLQLFNIDEAHVAPAQQSLTNIIIPEAKPSAAVEPLDKTALHLDAARKMLADLTNTFENVKRDQHIADAMQKLSRMYQVFVEDTQAFLGSSKPNLNNYDRKIAEVDEAFVEKLKEMLEAKKKIMDELAKVLAEDPRLLRRYLAMLELQGSTYRDQMTILARDQQRLQEQVDQWNAAEEGDRATLLNGFRAAFAEQSRELLEASAKLRENMETWLPLDVKTDEPRVRAALDRADKIVRTTGDSLASGTMNGGAEALAELRALRESLPEFNEITSTNASRISEYIANRLPEIDALISGHSGRIKIHESLDAGDFTKVAEIEQYQITQQTFTLGEKLDATEQQVSRMSAEIAAKAEELNRIVQEDILLQQRSSGEHLADRKIREAGENLGRVVPAFANAEDVFDELMRMIIAKLDEAPAGSAPGQGPDLEAILAMLEDEMKAAEGLGIPCRPINVSIMQDWMRPGSQPGQGMARAQAQAAQAQAEKARAEAERIAKEAEERAGSALSEFPESSPSSAEPREGDSRARGEAWNKLASQLRKDLLQGRDNTPPEQYRDAIESYFRSITGGTGK